MTANLTAAALLVRGRERLEQSSRGACAPATAQLDAEVLLAHALGAPRARLRSHPEARVEPSRAQLYLDLIARRAAGEPLAYLTGHKEFWSLDLMVTPAVLIPRPETELLVERALLLGSSSGGGPRDEKRVADLGTGSGAVALALARERPGWHIVATDVSAAALAVARANAAALGLRGVEFREGSWFEPLGHERFDLLVSNPPYIAADDPALADPALAFEPPLALTPGTDPLTCLTTLVRGAAAHLVRGGWLLLEHGATQGAQLRAALVAHGFAHVRSHRDLAAHERMTEGQR